MDDNQAEKQSKGWEIALILLQRRKKQDFEKASQAWERVVSGQTPEVKRSSYRLFFAYLRQQKRVDWELGRLLRRAPRAKVYAALRLGVAEMLIESHDRFPLVVDFCVGWVRKVASKSEASMANAVLRRAAESILRDDCAEKAGLATRYSHPEWLCERWLEHFGESATRGLLDWNARPAPVYLRIYDTRIQPHADLFETKWHGFYEWRGGSWDELVSWMEGKQVYIQDPLTRHSYEWLSQRKWSSCLELCAAPGGKTIGLAQLAQAREAELTAVDFPGSRLERLEENLKRTCLADVVRVHGADVLELDPRALGWGRELFDLVVIDVPCSNTGVIRRRPDVKDRLNADGILEMSQLQRALLAKACSFLSEGGLLLYSSCSLEVEENIDQVNALIEASSQNLVLIESSVDLPWVCGHDGGAAFLLELKRSS